MIGCPELNMNLTILQKHSYLYRYTYTFHNARVYAIYIMLYSFNNLKVLMAFLF